MFDTIKYIELLGKLKSDKIYYLYETPSSEINIEILSQIKKYESSLDFFSFYTKNNIKNLINSVNQIDKKLTSIFNYNLNNFSSNIDKYISQITIIILALNLIQKNQEILNKILLKSTQYLNEISKNCKIENIHQDKLLSLINNLQYNFSNDISSIYNQFSIASTKVSFCSTQYSWNKSSSQKQIRINNNKIQEEFFNCKKLSIVNEEILSDIQTPAFNGKNSNKDIFNSATDFSNNNISNGNYFTISLRDMIFIVDSELKTDDISLIEKKSEYDKEDSDKINLFSFQKNKIRNGQDKQIKKGLLKKCILIYYY